MKHMRARTLKHQDFLFIQMNAVRERNVTARET
jgi:hypothetical protein